VVVPRQVAAFTRLKFQGRVCVQTGGNSLLFPVRLQGFYLSLRHFGNSDIRLGLAQESGAFIGAPHQSYLENRYDNSIVVC
jgi:hypothetical protein